MSEEQNKPPVSTPVTFQRTDDFISTYANSVFFEANAWDLKIIFGQVEQQPDGSAVVKQHVAVTIPWSQAKLGTYWLRAQVEATEIQSGKIGIRKDLIPPAPPSLSPEQENDSDAKAIHDLVVRLRDEFLSTL